MHCPWSLRQQCRSSCPQPWRHPREVHLTLKQANYDLGKHQFNTCSAGMKMLNALEKTRRRRRGRIAIAREGFSILLRLLRHLPHIAHALWRELAT